MEPVTAIDVGNRTNGRSCLLPGEFAPPASVTAITGPSLRPRPRLSSRICFGKALGDRDRLSSRPVVGPGAFCFSLASLQPLHVSSN
jgi:hypothetical protein